MRTRSEAIYNLKGIEQIDSYICNVHQSGIQNIKSVLAQCFYRRLQVTKFISICHELYLYVVGINLCTSTSIALFYCTVVRNCASE